MGGKQGWNSWMFLWTYFNGHYISFKTEAHAPKHREATGHQLTPPPYFRVPPFFVHTNISFVG